MINIKWIFKRKFNFEDSLLHFKTHFVVHGFLQEEKIDYSNTCSLVRKMTFLRIHLALAML